MTAHNKIPSEMAALCGVVDLDANTATSAVTDYVDMSKFGAAMGIGLFGTPGASATITFSLIQATSADGSNAKAITGKAATALDATDGDKQVVLNVIAEELDTASGFTYCAAKQITTDATSDSATILLGLAPRNGPASDNDLASVAEIVN